MHKTTLKYNNCFLLKVKWARFFESANECHSVALIAIILLAHVSWKQVWALLACKFGFKLLAVKDLGHDTTHAGRAESADRPAALHIAWLSLQALWKAPSSADLFLQILFKVFTAHNETCILHLF